MKNRSVIAIGYLACGFHLVILLLYFLTLLGNPDGASIVISLIVGVPFLALSGAGCWMIGRIRWVPSFYLLISNLVLALVYWKSNPLLEHPFDVISLAIGIPAVLLSLVVAVLALSARRYYPAQKFLTIAAILALALLCLAAVVFFCLYSLIVLPHGSVSSLPISSHLLYSLLC